MRRALRIDWVLMVPMCVLAVVVRAENPRAAQRRNQVLVVANTNSAVSQAIARDYALWREIPNTLVIGCPDSATSTKNETIPLAAYVRLIEMPVRDYLASHTNIEFIVLTKGIPIRVNGAAIGSADEHTHDPIQTRGNPSVDSCLAALDYTNLPGTLKIDIAGSGAVGFGYSNRYWNATEPFSHAKFGVREGLCG